MRHYSQIGRIRNISLVRDSLKHIEQIVEPLLPPVEAGQNLFYQRLANVPAHAMRRSRKLRKARKALALYRNAEILASDATYFPTHDYGEFHFSDEDASGTEQAQLIQYNLNGEDRVFWVSADTLKYIKAWLLVKGYKPDWYATPCGAGQTFWTVTDYVGEGPSQRFPNRIDGVRLTMPHSFGLDI